MCSRTGTSLLTDPPTGRLPDLTPQATARQTARTERRQTAPYDGPEDLSLQVRCITYGIPRVGGLGAGYNSYPDLPDPGSPGDAGRDDPRRADPGDQRRAHVADDIRQWHGDARARWEGDTLVVETTNFDDRALYRGSGAGRHLVERFTLVGPDALEYEITLNDPDTWTAPGPPWSATAGGGGGLRVRLSRGQHRDARHSLGARVQELRPTSPSPSSPW